MSRTPAAHARLIRVVSAIVRRVMIGRVPKLFDPGYYLRQNNEVAASGIDPYLHFVWRGAANNLDPAEDFDTAFFRRQTGATRLDPIRHYLRFGAEQGLDPHPGFSSTSYLVRNPDVAAAGINPLVHYRTHGRAEGRGAGPSAVKTAHLAALRQVASRHVRCLPADGWGSLSVTLRRDLTADDEPYESVPRLCVLLDFNQDEIVWFVAALESMRAGGPATITLEVIPNRASRAVADRSGKEAKRTGPPRQDTLIASFEHCYVAMSDKAIKVRYAELRLWDLRPHEPRVAEIFQSGTLEFHG